MLELSSELSDCSMQADVERIDGAAQHFGGLLPRKLLESQQPDELLVRRTEPLERLVEAVVLA